MRRVVCVSAVSMALVGCASGPQMAFQKNGEGVPEKSAVYLMTATLKNDFHPKYQPQLEDVQLVRTDARPGTDTRLDFPVDDKARNETGSAQGNSYLLRLTLPAGAYDLRGFGSQSGTFPVHGTFFAPVHAHLDSQGRGVYYLGHVTATVRERKDDEFKAGPSTPLIDQLVIGASGGTFDVVVSDEWVADEAQFLERFPALKNVQVTKTVFPPIDRAKAQAWWEAH